MIQIIKEIEQQHSDSEEASSNARTDEIHRVILTKRVSGSLSDARTCGAWLGWH